MKIKKVLVALLLGLLSAASTLQAKEVLHVYNWNNYIASGTLKRFESSCNCTVIQDYYGSMEEMLAKLNAGAQGYDVIVPTGFAVTPLIKEKLVASLDKAKLTHWGNINLNFLNQFYDPGNQYSVPYAFTTTLVGYNDTKIKELKLDPGTWSIIFDPKVLEKIKGKVTVLDDSREVFAAALMYNGFSANSVNPQEWEKAKSTILKAKPYWAAFNGQSYIKELTIGNIWVAHGYSSDMYQASQDTITAKRAFSVSYTLQKEGNTLSIDNMMMLANAPRPDLAIKFINFMLEGKNASELTNMMGMGNPNWAAVPFIHPEVRKKVSVIPPDEKAMKKLQQLQSLESKQLRSLNRLWTQIKTAN